MGITVVDRLMFVNIEVASRFDAVGTAGTILPPVNTAIFAYPMKFTGS
jgi:hypothetical protein